jgi:outer membrane autotransporter protein
MTNTAAGTVTTGSSTPGMMAMGSGSSLTNLGTISVGSGASGMVSSGSNTTFTNGGTINVGASGTGIAARGAGSTATNSGTINIGTGGFGIAGGAGTILASSGTINVGTSGIGMVAQGNGVGLSNSGIINVGSGGYGMQTTSANAAVSSGTINVATSAFGMAGGGGAALTNSGTVNVGTGGIGMAAQGNGVALTNGGTIATCGTGMDGSGGSGSRVSNSGTISSSGCAATGVNLGQASSFTNSGLISTPTVIAMGAGSGGASVTNSGTLNGAIALSGSGGNTLVNSGTIAVAAPLSPGSGVAHVVDGTFTQTASGVFLTRLSPNNAPTNYDTLAVLSSVAGTGVANLGGAVQVSLQPGLYPLATTYTGVLTFSRSTGSFTGIVDPYTFLNAAAVYNPTSVDIVVTRVPFNQPASGGGNAQAIGNVLEANYSPFLTGQLGAFYMALLQSTAPNTLSQLTGEVATAPQNAAFGVFGQYISTIFGQTGSARSFGGAPQSAQRVALPAAEACVGESCDASGQPAIRYNAWAQGFGGSGSIDGNTTNGSSRIDMNAGGGATGMDVRLDNNAMVGFALGMGSAGYTLTDILSSGSSRSIIAGLYGGYARGPAYLDGALAYAYNTFTSTRFIGTGSISEIENASFNGSQYGGRLEGGWRFAFDRNLLTPFAGLTAQALSQSAYTENSRNAATGGPGILGVSVQAQTTTSIRSTLGGQFETAFTFNDDNVLRPRLRLGWAHEYNTNRTSTVTLSTLLPGSPFLVTGAQPLADSLVVGAGFDVELGRMVRLYGQFDADVTANARAFSGTGGFRLVW